MSELGNPVRKFSDTFSAESAVLEKFFEPQKPLEPAVSIESAIAELVEEEKEKLAQADDTNLGWFVGKIMRKTNGVFGYDEVEGKVSKALNLRKRTPITAVLREASIYRHNGKFFATGFIAADATNRFRDGLIIQTSEIKGFFKDIIQTRNSTYYIISYKQDFVFDPFKGETLGKISEMRDKINGR